MNTRTGPVEGPSAVEQKVLALMANVKRLWPSGATPKRSSSRDEVGVPVPEHRLVRCERRAASL